MIRRFLATAGLFGFVVALVAGCGDGGTTVVAPTEEIQAQYEQEKEAKSAAYGESYKKQQEAEGN